MKTHTHAFCLCLLCNLTIFRWYSNLKKLVFRAQCSAISHARTKKKKWRNLFWKSICLFGFFFVL